VQLIEAQIQKIDLDNKEARLTYYLPSSGLYRLEVEFKKDTNLFFALSTMNEKDFVLIEFAAPVGIIKLLPHPDPNTIRQKFDNESKLEIL
jgi:hypothetical protein